MAVSGSVLADVLIIGAIDAVDVGRQFREEGEHAIPIPAKDDDRGVHHQLNAAAEEKITGQPGY